ncbi:MAG: NADH-quinone oxidoreductase subunit NuoG [Gammaproteobacteria bacterium]|nr:NADH-quinone oxidoreductase subunit NuoG [Gammaproteobacteria bacterium]MDJ0871401.1 NADH-quinone oxidoreductase subunit NuoG [Gammaproteobacteria bacterium]
MSEDLLNIEINGQPLQARRGAMIIEAADAAGIQIPRFCYHKKLSVAANCRMCLVEVEKAPKPLPACATPVADGMKVRTRSALARDGQRSVMEFLLINHPLDCPICDQGGECELQDVAMGFGGDISRFQERKRVVKDKDIGPLIATDMTRCIHCTRCVRFGEEIAGVRELGATGRGEDMEIGTFVEKSVDSELSGNVIDLCPVGALTSKPFRYSARSWEMVQRSTIAAHDAVGSNLHVHVRRNRVMRVVPRENEDVNETWISDRDRFSYEGLYSEDRLSAPAIKRGGSWADVDWDVALDFAANGIRRVVAERGAQQLGALASPNSTLEELCLLQKLLRGMGSSNVDHRLRQADFSDQDVAPLFPWLGQSIADLELLDAVLLVGADVRKEQPLINNRLRKAALRGAGIMVVNALEPNFNYPTEAAMIVPPGDMPGVLAGIAKALGVRGGKRDKLLESAQVEPAHEAIAERLKNAGRASVLVGAFATSHPQAADLRALAGLICEAADAALGYLPAGANGAGAWLAGALPHRGPAGQMLADAGADAQAMMHDGLAGYVLLGVEPELDCWDSAAASNSLREADFVVALTAYRTSEMDEYADVLLPVSLFAETSGTFVNAEGRWQSFEAVAAPVGDARPGWRVLRVLGNLLDLEGFVYTDSQQIRDELKDKVGEARADNNAAWREPSRLDGKRSGLTRIGDVPVYAVDPVVRRGKALQGTRDACDARLGLNATVAAKLGLQQGDRARVTQEGGEVVLEVELDTRVPDDCVHVRAGVPGSVGLGPCIGEIKISKA